MAEFFDFFSQLPEKDVWQALRESHRPVVVWGMGNGADKLFARCAETGIPISAVFASDGFVRGQSFRGMQVLSYAEVCRTFPDCVVLLAFGSRREEVLASFLAVSNERPLFVPDLPVAGQTYFDAAFFKANREKINCAFSLFTEERSSALYAGMVRYKLSAGIYDLLSAVCDDTVPGEFSCKEGITVDCGAYDGDTVRRLHTLSPSLRRFVAIEPDRKNFARLSRYAAQAEGVEILPVHAACGAEDGMAVFYAEGNRNSALGAAFPQAKSESVPLRRVDTLLGEKRVCYLKMDVEGAELDALRGSMRILHRDRPVLRIALYHRSEDLFRIPLFLAENVPGYRFYLRRARCVPAWECDLIAVPDEKGKEKENA